MMMFTNLFGTRTPRRPERGRFFRPELEPLEDRLSPSSLQGGGNENPFNNPHIDATISFNAAAMATAGTSFDQLAGRFLNSYNLAAQQNAPQTNALVFNEFMLAASAYFSTVLPLSGTTSAAFQTYGNSLQDAINQNPMEQTQLGQWTGTLAFALMTKALRSNQTRA
jgi:hypothetical protein